MVSQLGGTPGLHCNVPFVSIREIGVHAFWMRFIPQKTGAHCFIVGLFQGSYHKDGMQKEKSLFLSPRRRVYGLS